MGWRGIVVMLGTCAAACKSPSGTTCGEGTELVGAMCVVAAADAHPTADGDTTPDAPPTDGVTFQILAPTNIDADGHTPNEVLVVARSSDGSAAHVDVVLNTDRAGAGTFTPAALSLGDLGGTSTFVACNATTPGCTGPLTMFVALASAPTVPVAHVDVMLSPPPGVGSASYCLTGGNVLYLQGDDYILNGTATITSTGWSWTPEGTTETAHLQVSPIGTGQPWDLHFETKQLGVPMTPSTYLGAQLYVYAQPGHPGLQVFGNGHGCNTITGAFQIHEYAYDVPTKTVHALTASFEQHCEGNPNTVLVGCVHFAQ
jgi:hypothetical protein